MTKLKNLNYVTDTTDQKRIEHFDKFWFFGLLGLWCLLVLYRSFQPASIIAIVEFAVAGFIICRLHAAVTNLNPLETMVSEYALDPKNGQWMHLAFFLIGFGALNIGTAVCKLDLVQYNLEASNKTGKFGHLTWWPQLLMLIALVFISLGAIGMGFFSMRSQTKEELPSSEESGKWHDWCVMMSFGAAIVSMLLFTCSPAPIVGAALLWLRAFGLVFFSFALLATIFYVILGYYMSKKVSSPNENSANYVAKFSGLSSERSGYGQNSANGARALSPMNAAQASQVAKANMGQGMLERILIFMFIQWGLFLSMVLVAPK